MRLLLDMGTVFIGGAMLIWYVALGPAVAAAGGRFDLFNLVIFAYPVGDLLLLFGILAVLWRGAPQSSVAGLADLRGRHAGSSSRPTSSTTTSPSNSTYLGGDPVDTLWMLALVIVYLAAACQLRTKPAGSPRAAAAARTRAPVLPALPGHRGQLPAAGRRRLAQRQVRLPGGGILLGAVALTFLVSARQYIALHDYGRLAVRYQELASIDGMTGLYNRRHFMEVAEAAFAHAQRLGQPLVALMIDVDNFKQINDTHGHIAGDQVLAELAQACREHVRPDDIVGRYGGDEFIIIVPGITSLRATQIADQLARPAARVLGRDGKPLAYTASVGIAECPPGCDLPTLLIHADLAMYEAKRAGGGSWRIFGRDGNGAGSVPSPASPQMPPALRAQGSSKTRTVWVDITPSFVCSRSSTRALRLAALRVRTKSTMSSAGYM